MDAMTTFRECLAEAVPAALTVQGCIGIYHACGDEAARTAVLEWVKQGACAADGRALIYAWQETGNEAYRQAAADMAGRSCLDKMALAEAYRVLPFLMAYEMKLNRMENVGGVTRGICRLHAALWHAGEGPLDVDSARFVLALADTVEECTEQLYEHWRALVDLYRVTVRDVLPLLDTVEGSTAAVLACGLLKGVRLGLIEGERYLPLALRILEKTEPAVLNADGLGALMQSCAELLRLER